MQLKTNCKNCQSEIRIKKSVNDRLELALEIGEISILKCEQCLEKRKYHVNEIIVKESKSILLFALFIFIFGTGSLFYFFQNHLISPNSLIAFGGLLIIPSLIYAILTKQEEENVRRFNQYKY
jgi:hypothetical protein